MAAFGSACFSGAGVLGFAGIAGVAFSFAGGGAVCADQVGAARTTAANSTTGKGIDQCRMVHLLCDVRVPFTVGEERRHVKGRGPRKTERNGAV
jgi:hypothetical protein